MNVIAIVPAFNEEKTIKNVLTVLDISELINEIVVVDDASTDDSLKIVQSFKSKKIKIISLKKNVGKSDAVKIATKNLNADVLFFCDADLHDFKQEHIGQILEPFGCNKKVMSVGLRDYGVIINFIASYFFPLITGERALSYSIFKNVVDHPQLKAYNMEVILNNYCKIHNISIHKKVMKGLRQTAKYKKWKNGGYLLTKQIFQIIIAMFILRIRPWRKT